jgi:hypothetical protein
MPRRFARPAVEQLEDRRLPSAVAQPATISLKPGGRGTFDVVLLSDDGFAQQVLQTFGTVTTTVTGANGRVVTLTPISAYRASVDGDKIADLVQTFSRSALRRLPSGNATVTLTLTAQGLTTTETLVILLTGGNKTPSHRKH